jgi:hypothetical protein
MRQFTYVVHAEIALPPHRTAAGSVDPFLVTKVDRPSGRFVVPEASHPIVTNRARSGRQLLVAQQVTDSISNVPVVECDKTGMGFAVYRVCRFTSG